jgi:hypothetical protein
VVFMISGALVVAYSLRPGPIDSARPLRNPLGIEAWGSIAKLVIPALGFALAAIFVSAIAVKLWSYRRLSGGEREQIKWFAFSLLVLPAGFVLGIVAEIIWSPWASDAIGLLAFVLGFPAIAGAIGVAIFKYRLFDIDVVINKALVYGSLTALLAVAYFSIVVIVQRVVPGAGESTLTVAGSTLVVAALFRPLRSSLQGLIDRRFYRRKYDAAKSLASFSERQRAVVDLHALESELVGVVRETMQPSHVSLWLRPSTKTSPERAWSSPN